MGRTIPILAALGLVVVVTAMVGGITLLTATDDDAGDPGQAWTTERDDELAELSITLDDLGDGFVEVTAPAEGEVATGCGGPGIDDRTGTVGRSMIAVENEAGTLDVVATLRAFPDDASSTAAYDAAVAALNCPSVDIEGTGSPTVNGAEVPGLAVDQAYAVDLYPPGVAGSDPPVGGGFAARDGSVVLTVRYEADPDDPDATDYDLAALVRAAVDHLNRR